MIRILLTRRHKYPVRRFLRGRGRALRGSLRFRTYDQRLPRWRRDGTWIFADIERLHGDLRERVARFHNDLAPQRRLNHPLRSMRRPEILLSLREGGINTFGSDPVDAEPDRWPVFLRGSHDHRGNLSPLLENGDAYRAAAMELPEDRDVLHVEFLDTRCDDGLYRKYSAFRIGNRIVPRHIFFGREWMLKDAHHVDASTVAEELEYIHANPHEEELRRIFDLARIEYGRIDYALLDGRPQVWEINTNPMIMSDVSTEADRPETIEWYIRKFGYRRRRDSEEAHLQPARRPRVDGSRDRAIEAPGGLGAPASSCSNAAHDDIFAA